ncbi:hypothetical protein EalM132_00125 [Exiguobacterium phage vB_EalM-132]|nr:hypothetical protein EalM132_00125 [Exiguobacterium phage vB_EalM-132]
MSSFRKEFNVKVNLGSGRVIDVDVFEQLHIDTSDILEELLNQPSKYALWATVHEVNAIKLENVRKELTNVGSSRYHEVFKQFTNVQVQQHLLTTIKKAFQYRTQVLLVLLNNPEDKNVLALYKKHIRALKDNVPYGSTTQEVI